MACRIGETRQRIRPESSKGTYQVCRLKKNAQIRSRLWRWYRALALAQFLIVAPYSLQRLKLIHSRSRHSHVEDVAVIVTERFCH